FVIADIPGIIRGASKGLGLGVRFLKHLTRCRVMLHTVDMAPVDESDPVENAKAVEAELEEFSPTLARRERWLVLNKIDLLPPDEVDSRCKAVVDALQWTGPVFQVSAIQRVGTLPLCGR